MKIRLNKCTDRLEIRTKKRMIAFHCDILKGSYYLVQTVDLTPVVHTERRVSGSSS